jgi:hypothetical protein
MNPEEDEDAFLYGDGPQQSTTTAGKPAASAQEAVDQEMEQASEGEVEDEDGEEESDSVSLAGLCVLNGRILSLLLKQSLGNGQHLHRKRKLL